MPQTPLHEIHVELGARMVPFAGWEMPIQYNGIVAEHKAVRESAGIFDISHMGELFVEGPDAEASLNALLTNDLGKLEDGRGQYTLMLNEKGGVIDDLIAYRLGPERFFLVVNAAKVGEDVVWLEQHLSGDATLTDRSGDFGAVAVQGPKAKEVWESASGGPNLGGPNLGGPSLPERNGIAEDPDTGLILCRTGYTGEDGFELFAPADSIAEWFRELRNQGAAPSGLGARDTLRLEKCLPLNGADLDPDHTPLEAGLGMFVALDKPGGFIGREVLAAQKSEGLSRRLLALKVTGKSPPPRHGYEVRDAEGEQVLGELTSGTLSPSLGVGIGLAYLDVSYRKPGTEVSIAVRNRVFPAQVVKKPFYPET